MKLCILDLAVIPDSDLVIPDVILQMLNFRKMQETEVRFFQTFPLGKPRKTR